MIRLRNIGLVFLTFAYVAIAEAKVKHTPLSELIRSADAIVFVKVVKVDDNKHRSGAKDAQRDVAAAKVLEVWKGKVGDTVEFSVKKTWPCDVSGAVVDEQAVLILSKSNGGPEPVRASPGVYFLSFSGRGRMPIVAQQGAPFARVQVEVLLPEGDLKILRSPEYPDDNLADLDKLRTYIRKLAAPDAAQQGIAPDGRSPAAPARR